MYTLIIEDGHSWLEGPALGELNTRTNSLDPIEFTVWATIENNDGTGFSEYKVRFLVIDVADNRVKLEMDESQFWTGSRFQRMLGTITIEIQVDPENGRYTILSYEKKS